MRTILIIIGISLLAKSSYAAGDFFKDYTPLPKGEYIFEIRRTDSGACDDRNNISATVKADSVRSTQPQEARVPPDPTTKCSDPKAVRIPWNNYRGDDPNDLIRTYWGWWGNNSAPIDKNWNKFCFWVDTPDVYEIKLSTISFGSSQCAKYELKMNPPRCGAASSGGTYSTASGTYPYVVASESTCGGKEPFNIAWSSEGPLYTPRPNIAPTPLPSSTVIPAPPYDGSEVLMNGNVGMDRNILLSYQNTRDLKWLEFSVEGNGITLSVEPPPNSLLYKQTPSRFLHLGTTNDDAYARVPKGIYGVRVYGPTSTGSRDACEAPSQENWKLLSRGQNIGASSGPVFLRFRLPRKATSLNFKMDSRLLGNINFYRGGKEIFQTREGKASIADLGGDAGVYYIKADSYGDYDANITAYDESGEIPDGQPSACSNAPVVGSFKLKVKIGNEGFLPPSTPTPVPTRVPTRTPVPTPTPTAAPPGIFIGDNFKKENFVSFSSSDKLAAILIDTKTDSSTDIIPEWADVAVILYSGSKDNQKVSTTIWELLFKILARQPHAKVAPSMFTSEPSGLRNFYSIVPAELWAGINGYPIGQGDLTSGILQYRQGFKDVLNPIQLPDTVRFFSRYQSDDVRQWKGLTLESSFTELYVPNPQESGSSKAARIRVKNTGTSSWSPYSDFSLVNTISGESYQLTRDIFPNSEQDFYSTLNVGQTYKWSMSHNSETFGEQTATYTITEIESSPTATPQPSPTAVLDRFIPPTPTPTSTPECPTGYRFIPAPYGIPGRCYPM